jgi:hypothetical protein
MAYLYHKLTRKLLLSLILIWGVVAFWIFNTYLLPSTLVAAVGFGGLIFIWLEIAPIYLLIFLAFTSSYAFYGLSLHYNLPTYLIMLSILIIFGYIFTYMEQRTGILGNKRLIFLLLFSILVLEVFLALSYFLINPLNQSLVIASVCYMFSGFCFSVLAKQPNSNLITYLVFGLSATFLILLSSSWSV